jgi:acyl carrier protein
MNITAQVIEIIAQQALLQPSDVKIDHTLEDLGIDSLGLVESIFAIEEAFDITVPFNANDPNGGDFDITTVGSIIKAVQTLVQDQT